MSMRFRIMRLLSFQRFTGYRTSIFQIVTRRLSKYKQNCILKSKLKRTSSETQINYPSLMNLDFLNTCQDRDTQTGRFVEVREEQVQMHKYQENLLAH